MSSLYTVYQITKYIKTMFRQDILLERVCVSGEVSNCKYHHSGHIYFTLKDEQAQISCVMFRSSAAGMGFRMNDGDSVNVTGRIDVFEKQGSYQLYAQKIEKSGAGRLYERYLELKEKLEEMGMFSSEYKRPIPPFAKKVGIVTAPDGAAIRDIQNISRRRSPGVELFLYPALVQGEGAKESIVRGIRTLDKLGLDVIIVGRGGGSIEDLWAFNEECVAEAIFQCSTPVISAVGHETDFTIADFVADLRAPTPSAAAELAVPDAAAYIEKTVSYERELMHKMNMLLQAQRTSAEHYSKRLSLLSPVRSFERQKEKLEQISIDLNKLINASLQENMSRADSYHKRIPELFQINIGSARHRFGVLCERLDGRSPVKKLSSGYAYVSDGDGHAVTSADQVVRGDRICISVADGRIDAEVTDAVKEGRL